MNSSRDLVGGHFYRLIWSAMTAVLFVVMPSCSKPAPVQKPKTFTHVHTYSPTPREHATERYSDFKYELRKFGETNFQTFLPKTVKPTQDRSVEARFEITIPEPAEDEKYECRTSYRFDGELTQDRIRETVFIARVKKDQ